MRVQSNSSATSDNEPIRILIVEDEPGIAGFLRRGLIFEGYVVEVAEDGRTALTILRDRPPDLLLLDVMVPMIDGFDLSRRLRAAEAEEGRSPLPILMLTARDSVPDRIAGLDAGADDYLVKPFDFDELLARLRALLRRTATTPADQSSATLQFADLSLDPRTRAVYRGPRELALTPREFDLLTLLLQHPKQVLTRQLLMNRIWGADFYGDSNVLEVYVASLRRNLEIAGEPRLIYTVRGVGYVLREQAAQS